MEPSRGRRLSGLLLLLALPAVPAALAPFLSRWHWSLDLLACFAPHAMLWLAGAGALLLASRRRLPALACLLAAAPPALLVIPSWLPAAAPQTTAAAAPTLTVCTVNLLRGNHRALAAAVAAIRERDPDVVFCSEVTPEWLAGLAGALPDHPHRCEAADPGFFGVALLSRLPLQDAQVIPLPFTWAPAVRAVVVTAAGPVGILGVHAPRPGAGHHSAERDAALAAIPTALAPLPPRRIVLGDCNATPWNHGFRALLAATGLATTPEVCRAGTWPASLPLPLRLPIDHVLAGPGVKLLAAGTGSDFGSDHLPVWATVHLLAPD